MKVKVAGAFFLFLLCSPLISQPNEEDLQYSIILIGDAGEHRPFSKSVFKMASDRIRRSGKNSAVIFLGDNIYPLGLPTKENPERSKMEGKLSPQLEVIRNSEGRGFIIPGNHDWAKGRKSGRIHLLEHVSSSNKCNFPL